MILGIDTSGKNLGLALCDEGRLIASSTICTDLRHGEILQLRLQKFLKANGLSFDSLTGISVTLGPGSYTGLRISLVAAKGYAYALAIPLLGISTLMAAASAYRNYPKQVCPMLDARRRELYRATFDCSRALPRRLSPDMVGGFGELAASQGEDLLIFGPAALEAQIMRNNSRCEYAINDDYNLAEGAARLGEIDISGGRRLDVATAVPSYIRRDFDRAKS